jgi:hypothetical protein
MPERGQYVTYPLKVKPETIDAYRNIAKRDGITITKAMRDVLEMGVRVDAQVESRRQQQLRMREEVMREQVGA